MGGKAVALALVLVLIARHRNSRVRQGRFVLGICQRLISLCVQLVVLNPVWRIRRRIVELQHKLAVAPHLARGIGLVRRPVHRESVRPVGVPGDGDRLRRHRHARRHAADGGFAGDFRAAVRLHLDVLHLVAAVVARGEHRVVRRAHGRHRGGIGRVAADERLVRARAVIPADKPVARRGRRRRGDGRPRQLRRLCLAHRAIDLARDRRGRHIAVAIHIAHLELHSRHKARVVGRIASHRVAECPVVQDEAVGNPHKAAVLLLIPALEDIVLRVRFGRAVHHSARAHSVSGMVERRNVFTRHLNPFSGRIGNLPDIVLHNIADKARVVFPHVALAHLIRQFRLNRLQFAIFVIPALKGVARVCRRRHSDGFLLLREVADAICLCGLYIRFIFIDFHRAAGLGSRILAICLLHTGNKCLLPLPLRNEGQAHGIMFVQLDIVRCTPADHIALSILLLFKRISPIDDYEGLLIARSVKIIIAGHRMFTGENQRLVVCAYRVVVIRQLPACEAPALIRYAIGGLGRRVRRIGQDPLRSIWLEAVNIRGFFGACLSAVVSIAAVGVIGNHRALDEDEVQLNAGLNRSSRVGETSICIILRPRITRPTVPIGDEYLFAVARLVVDTRKGHTSFGEFHLEIQRNAALHIGVHILVRLHLILPHLLVIQRADDDCTAVRGGAGRQRVIDCKSDAVQKVAKGLPLIFFSRNGYKAKERLSLARRHRVPVIRLGKAAVCVPAVVRC